MKNTYILPIAASLIAASVFITSCNKDKPEPDTESQSSVDNSMAEAEFSYVSTEVNGVAINEKGLQKKTFTDTCTFYNKGCAGCVAVFTITPCDSGIYPKTAVIDFSNNTTCVSCDGRIRRGKLVVSFSAPWKNAGSVATVTTENFYVNGKKVEAKVILTNLNGIDTLNASVTPKFRRQVMGLNGSEYATIETLSGTIQHKGDVTVEQAGGHTTPGDVTDDVTTVFGNSSGINRKGRAYSVTIAESAKIKKAVSCKWIQDGTLELTPNNLVTRSIDFAYPAATGAGTCDSLVEITVNGNSFAIGLE